MKIRDFKERNKINSEIELKDGRFIYTTNNGFKYWIATAKGVVEESTEEFYNKAKKHVITKRIRREMKK